MHIKGQVDIKATPEQVWPFLVDPVIQAAWNPKIISINRAHDGPVGVGETYTMIAKMSGTEKTSQAEVMDVTPARRLVVRHRMIEAQRESFVTETYLLKPTRNGTRVTHDINLRQAGIPRVFLLLIWVITRVGKPQGEPYLKKLKTLIEADLKP